MNTPSYIAAKRETDITQLDKYFKKIEMRTSKLEEFELLNQLQGHENKKSSFNNKLKQDLTIVNY